MKKPTHALIKALALATFATSASLTLSMSALGGTIVSDAFDDGDVVDGVDAQDIAWTALFNLNGGSPSVVSTGSLPGTGNAMNVDVSSTFGAVKGALPTNSALNLAVGDTLTYSCNVLYTQAPANNGVGFRFGIFDSTGLGVGVLVGTGTTAGFSIVRDLNITGATDLLSGGGNHTLAFSAGSAAGDTGTNNTDFVGMVTPTIYAISFSMTRNASSISYSATVNGVATATATDFDDTGGNNTVGADFLTNFSGGYLIIRNGTPQADFRVDDVLVTTTGSTPTGYNSWIDSALYNTPTPLTTEEKLPNSDPDVDGISNLLEFSLGGNPVISSQDILPKQTLDASNITLHFKRSDASESSTTLKVQISEDLSDWTTIMPITIGAASAGGVTVDELLDADDDITVLIPRDSSARKFVRLEVINY